MAFDALFNQVLGTDGGGGVGKDKKKPAKTTNAEGETETEETLLGGLLDRLRSMTSDEVRQNVSAAGGGSILGGGRRKRQ